MNSKIGVLIIGTATAFMLTGCSEPGEPPTNASATNADDEAGLVEYLFVQHADKVSLDNGVLTLEGIGNDVLYFSDRPNRIVGRESLEAFIDDWDEGEGSFATIPPNAIVAVVRGGESFDLAVVLTEPIMVGDNSMTYNVDVLDGPDFGVGDNAAIFIDAFGLEPGGKRGVETRVGRPGDPDIDPDIDPDVRRKDLDPDIDGKRGRDGTREFRGKRRDLDRRL